MDITALTLAVCVVIMLIATYAVALLWRHIRRTNEETEWTQIVNYRREHGGGVTAEIASGREPLPKEWVEEWRKHRRRWVR